MEKRRRRGGIRRKRKKYDESQTGYGEKENGEVRRKREAGHGERKDNTRGKDEQQQEATGCRPVG